MADPNGPPSVREGTSEEQASSVLATIREHFTTSWAGLCRPSYFAIPVLKRSRVSVCRPALTRNRPRPRMGGDSDENPCGPRRPPQQNRKAVWLVRVLEEPAYTCSSRWFLLDFRDSAWSSWIRLRGGDGALPIAFLHDFSLAVFSHRRIENGQSQPYP